ncbi:MAG: polysaccharide deacetylase family protein [Prolixibacteraceae bacterium]|nr:polysaccharide deacetylase family protein [Prolixibacteraceae bacterium]
MNRILTLFSAMIMTMISLSAQDSLALKLLIRADDIGSSHAANRACIDAYVNGIARSVEIMVCCPWFPEAAKMLNENPGYDVGIHLMLTSEWDNIKWRPLTYSPSLVDSNGYFFPMVWPNDNYPPHRTLKESNWKIKEIEQELRAQIELALKHIPQVSHVSNHMGFTGMDQQVRELVKKLAFEYGLGTEMPSELKRFPGWSHEAKTLEEKVADFVENINQLAPGTYLFVEHPAYNEPEMQATGHTGYEHVAIDREHVTRVFTSPEVIKSIHKKGVKLVGYNDL